MNSNKKSSTKARANESARSGSRQTRSSNSQKSGKGKNNAKINNGNGPIKKMAIAQSSKQSTTRAFMVADASSCRVKHRELLFTLGNSSNLFTVAQRLRMNPGSAKAFPWLSGIANNYETYKFLSLRIRSIPRCSSTTPGSILLSPDYDATDQPPGTEQEASNNVDSVEDVPWQEIVLHLSPQRMNRAYKQHFVMTDNRFSTTAQDQKTVDAAQVFVCTDGSSVGSYSKVWIEYEVLLSTPQQPTLPLSQGGAGTNKVTGLAPNVGNVFTTNTITTLLQESAPLLEQIDPSQFPGQFLFKVARDWSGLIEKEVSGSTGLSDIGNILIKDFASGTVAAKGPINDAIINGGGTRGTATYEVKLRENDLIGSNLVTATTLGNMIHNFGGAGYF